MWDYVLVASCFLVLIAIKFYLFKVSYDKKMKYFTDPNELAIEFISNQKKMNTEQQQHVLLENLHKLADHNMRQLAEACKNPTHLQSPPSSFHSFQKGFGISH